MNANRASLLYLPRSTREKGRRDFLAWLAGGTALTAIGCGGAAEWSADPQTDESLSGGDDATCRLTSRDAQGPYWEPGSPVRATQLAGPDEPGVRFELEGRLLGPDCRTPLSGYVLDVWQADKDGNYYTSEGGEYRLRGKIVTDETGRYRLETILPGRYSDDVGMRPAHLHFRFLTPDGNELLTTQLYFKGDPYLGRADYCTRDGDCNSSDARRQLRLTDTAISGKSGKRATFDAVLPST